MFIFIFQALDIFGLHLCDFYTCHILYNAIIVCLFMFFVIFEVWSYSFIIDISFQDLAAMFIFLHFSSV